MNNNGNVLHDIFLDSVKNQIESVSARLLEGQGYCQDVRKFTMTKSQNNTVSSDRISALLSNEHFTKEV